MKLRSTRCESGCCPPTFCFLLQRCVFFLPTHRYHAPTFQRNLKHHHRLLIFEHFAGAANRMQPPAPARGGSPAQTFTGKLNPPTPDRHHGGGGTPGNPSAKKPQATSRPPLNPDPTKPAGTTAQPAEPQPNQTGRAVSPCVYISHKAHGAGAPPMAIHNTATRRTMNSEPVGHAVH